MSVVKTAETLPAAPFANLIMELYSDQEQRGAQEPMQAAASMLGLQVQQVLAILDGAGVPFRQAELALLKDGRFSLGDLYDAATIRACRPNAKLGLTCQSCGTPLLTEAEFCGFCEVDQTGVER